jgi:hypothetical protein
MFLGGLWHGAGWTFAAWGMLHGLYLMMNYAWHVLRRALGQDLSRSTRLGRGIAQSMTLLAVIAGWVFFRSSSFEAAIRLIEAMAGFRGIAIPEAIARLLEPLRGVLSSAGVEFREGGGSQFVLTYFWVGTLSCIALFAPNTQEIMHRYRPGLDYHLARDGKASAASTTAWRPSRWCGVAIGIIFACGMLSLTRISEFLYFQF